MLLGQELSMSDPDFLVTNKMTYFSDMDDSYFVVGVESREDYPGSFHMVFALRDAIALSSILLGIPPARISEKRTLLILEADDIDAFSEIANQIIGSFNSAFQPALPNKVHLKQLPPTKFIPQMDEVTEEKPVPDGEYLLCRTRIEMQDQEMNRIDILIPLTLANMFDPQENRDSDEPGDNARDEADQNIDGPSDGTPSGPKAVLVLEDNAAERQHIQTVLADNGFKPITAPLSANVAELLTQNQVKAVVLGITKGNDREFSLCTRINAVCEQYSLPIIMSARQWTRTGVLRAVKHGARDILLKPYDAGELVERLGKFLDAA
jgi:CheY-like chemotaxis protein/chemotaxis protein CheY-P-specific phosphatase CheC